MCILRRRPKMEPRYNGQLEALDEGNDPKIEGRDGCSPHAWLESKLRTWPWKPDLLGVHQTIRKNLGFFHFRRRNPKIRRGVRLVIPLVFQGRNCFRFLTTVNLGLDPFFLWRRGFPFWITLGILWKLGMHRNRVTPGDSKKLHYTTMTPSDLKWSHTFILGKMRISVIPEVTGLGL